MKMKKLIAMICIVVILQSYFSIFSQIVIATSEAIIGGEEETSEIIGGEEEEPENTNPILGEEEEKPEEEPEEVTPPEEENGGTNPFLNDEEMNSGEEGEVAPILGEEPQPGEEETSQEGENPEIIGGEEPIPEEEPQEEPIGDPEEYIEPEVSVLVMSENASIYKGYLYANATSELRYATEYNTADVVNIIGGRNMSKLTIQDEPDKIQLITNIKIGLMNEMYYRQTRIDVEEFKRILGEEGIIEIYTGEGEKIGQIDKTTAIEEEEYVYQYPIQLNTVRFEIRNIKEDGRLIIKNDKAIKETSEFSRNQISLFSSINTMTEVNAYKGEEVKTARGEGNINLEETESKMTIGIDTETLSVEEENNVSIDVTLKTDEERYDLFENPSIDIEFPSAVEEVEVVGMTLLYKNGLSIDNWTIMTNAIGKKVLKINLLGSQLEYTPGAVQEGTTISIATKINVNRLTADTNENLRMTYTNKDTVRKSYILEGKDSEDINISFVGRQELVRSLSIDDETGDIKTSYDEKTEKIKLEAEEKQEVIIKGAIVNNYETTIQDVEIIGRIPFVGNKDMDGINLGTNFDATLLSTITSSGAVADVYYSEDGEAESKSSSWTQDVGDISKYKSYKIVLREKTLAKGEKLTFEYTLSIPEDIGNGAKGYTNYVVHYKIDTQEYKNQCAVGMYTEEKELLMDDIKEDAKQEIELLTVGTQVSQGGRVLGETDSVYERQVLRYTIVIKNTSNNIINNIKIRANAENANIYDWEYIDTEEGYLVDQVRQMKEYLPEEKEYVEFAIDTLYPEQSQTLEYQVVVRDLSEIEIPDVYGKIKILVEGYDETEITTSKKLIQEGKLEVVLTSRGTETADEMQNVTNISRALAVNITNISGEDLEDIYYEIDVPSNVSVFENMFSFTNSQVTYEVEKNVANNTKIKFNIPQLLKDEKLIIFFYVQNLSMDLSIYSTAMKITSYAKCQEETYNSNDFIRRIYQGETKLDYILTSDTDKEYVENGDVITFTLDMENNGYADSGLIRINEIFPNGLELVSAYFEKDNETTNIESNGNDSFIVMTSLGKGKKQKLVIVTKVNEKKFVRDQSVIEFKLNVSNGSAQDKSTNIISYKIHNTNVAVMEKTIEKNVDDVDKNDTKEETTSNFGMDNEDEEDMYDENDYDEYEDYTGEDYTGENSNTNTNFNENISSVSSLQTITQKVKTYYISGIAWIDSNQDGIRQAKESKKESVVATLYKANSNGGLDTSSAVATTATDKNGKYTFSGVEEGNYIVVFDYNASQYKVTKYQVETAKTDENSDAISKTITINGENQIVGVTDVLTITNASIMSLDIGLVDKTNFDFSLTKGIEKVTVRNEEGTKTYDYQGNTNARIEIKSKYYKNTTLDITYRFKVTNEGEVEGYVNKIVDYLPEGVEVVLNSSPGWYIGSDNGLYYTGLVEEEIKAGESKEFTLVIRRSLSDGEAVKLENSAEIVETTNKQGLVDRDSIEDNKMKQEDDYGTAILIVSVSTGKMLQYIEITVLIVIIVATIIFIIIKIANKKKFYR